ncbi:MAG: 2-C-methyl-D-erythritol 2,4-cyclodiphosphate synthase [Oscillospiraceae bacterium]|nr:2-C-methyl-D-erythritol 2,4-cyclodiphosphate synthase [Oscillospiraceae bacterium]
MFRIGHGYDVHRLVENRKLIIGGVEIPYHLGLQGHSDADVLLHAIMDAVIGALGLGDIGKHFPDTDEKYLNADSKELAKQIYAIGNFEVVNIDATIIAENPKMSSYIEQMKSNIAGIFHTENVNVKATTEEGMGFTGAGEGIAAHAVVLICRTIKDF